MSEYKADVYRDKSLSLDKRLSELEGGLAWASNDAAADLVREAREALAKCPCGHRKGRCTVPYCTE